MSKNSWDGGRSVGGVREILAEHFETIYGGALETLLRLPGHSAILF